MKQRNILLKLQKKYQTGGYALISPKSGKVHIFNSDLKKLYKGIDDKQIDDKNKLVMYVPPPHVKHVFHFSLSVRLHRSS